jgi:hypothetical protein
MLVCEPYFVSKSCSSNLGIKILQNYKKYGQCSRKKQKNRIFGGLFIEPNKSNINQQKLSTNFVQ